MPYQVEIVVEDVAGAIAAAQAGADSIELCADLDHGGVTPSPELIRKVVAAVRSVNPHTACHILVLNKPDGFYPDKDDVVALARGICEAKIAGADGVVFGALRVGNTLAVDVLEELVAVAKPMKVTFHRAFDRVPDPPIAFELLISLGFDRLLTSGGIGCATEHLEALADLVDQAQGRLTLVAGGGIRLSNIKQVALTTHAPVLHMSCRDDVVDVTTGLKPTCADRVREIVAFVRGGI